MSDIETLSPAKRALLEQALQRRRDAATQPPGIPRRSDRGPAPLSFSQQRIWFLEQWEPGTPTFNGARATRILGELDVDALHRSLLGVLERHESLRTVIAVHEREPRQVVPEEWSLELPALDLSAHPPAEREAELARILRELSREPFDLAADLMLRATLIRLAEREHVLLLRLHHVAGDAFSDAVLFGELEELYGALTTGRPPQLRELPIQYSDFTAWQRERLQGRLLDELVAYWTAQLEGSPPLLRLPTDRPRRTVQRHEGVHHDVSLSKALAEGVVSLGRDESVTVFMTLLAAFAVLLYRLSDEDDVVIGSPIANRNDLALEGLIGFFSNTMALRIHLGGNPSFREVLQRARETALGAYAHQDLPFEKVVEALRLKRDTSYNPLFQVNFRAQATSRPCLRLPRLETASIAIDIGFSRFDLALELQVEPEGITGFFEYDRDLFDAGTIAGFVEDLEALLDQVIADPETPVLAIRLPNGRRAPRGGAAPPPTAMRRRSTPESGPTEGEGT